MPLQFVADTYLFLNSFDAWKVSKKMITISWVVYLLVLFNVQIIILFPLSFLAPDI